MTCSFSQAFSGTEGRLLWEGSFDRGPSGLRPDLLLVDLMLPGLSGGELIAEVRKSSAVPVIVLSAKTELSDKVELLAGRPKRVFTKQQIYEAVWEQDYAVEDKTITVHISNIRAKLRP